MAERHFIVCERDRTWHYSFRGDSAGPFSTRDEAVAAAIEEAQQTNDPEVLVIVQDHDLQQETVWRSQEEPSGVRGR